MGDAVENRRWKGAAGCWAARRKAERRTRGLAAAASAKVDICEMVDRRSGEVRCWVALGKKGVGMLCEVSRTKSGKVAFVSGWQLARRSQLLSCVCACAHLRQVLTRAGGCATKDLLGGDVAECFQGIDTELAKEGHASAVAARISCMQTPRVSKENGSSGMNLGERWGATCRQQSSVKGHGALQQRGLREVMTMSDLLSAAVNVEYPGAAVARKAGK